MYFDELVGSRFEASDRAGVATVRLELREEHHGVHGFVHGGVLCTLAHQSAGAAAYARCRDGEEAVMIGMQMNFVKASWTGSLVSRSEVVRQGGRTSLVETRIHGDDGELRATASSTFLVLQRALQQK
ncbi:MAG: PaaI family thioesterase [Thermodesulfobacteriota bacterium]